MTDFRKGVFTGVVLYIVGAIVTVLSHLFIRWDYVQGPPPSFMVLLFFVLIGLYRLFKTAYRVSRSKDQRKNGGEMTVHLILFGLIFLFFVYANFLA
jgi:hypothetical protein